MEGNGSIVKGMRGEYEKFMSEGKKDMEGNIVNVMRVKGVEWNNVEVIGKEVERMGKRERRDGE